MELMTEPLPLRWKSHSTATVQTSCQDLTEQIGREIDESCVYVHLCICVIESVCMCTHIAVHIGSADYCISCLHCPQVIVVSQGIITQSVL